MQPKLRLAVLGHKVTLAGHSMHSRLPNALIRPHVDHEGSQTAPAGARREGLAASVEGLQRLSEGPLQPR
jgi:hypothetical protein